MEALNMLLNRVSTSRHREDMPDQNKLDLVYQSALRAADHANQRPWRFLRVSGQARQRLGQLMLDIAKADKDLDEEQAEKVISKAFRSPLIVIAVANIKQHPKVPEIEQLLSTGAAVQNMLNAAYAQGIGAIWRTGNAAFSPIMHKGLSLAENEKVVGFLYLGLPASELKAVPVLDTNDYFECWS